MRKLLLMLVAAQLACGEVPASQRGAGVQPPLREPVDWSQSVGIFIGVQNFVGGADAPAEVRYACDDAVDFSWALVRDLPSALPAQRTLLLLSGRPDKEISQEHLLELQRQGAVVVAAAGADAIYDRIHRFAANVGRNGVLILFIATHGFTAGDAHVLLTSDATKLKPRGVSLERMLRAIPRGHGSRVLMFVDACRAPYAPMPPGLFENLQFPGDYAIFVAAGPGGYALPDEQARNGFFTRAAIDGLSCASAADLDGFMTPGALGVYISDEVKKRSATLQRPEARFGGLADLQLFRCAGRAHAGAILSPAPNATVESSGTVNVRADAGGLYVTVLLCAVSSGRCWKQNRQPIPATLGEATPVGVEYGDTGLFRIHVALTPNAGFLHGEQRFAAVPLNRRSDGVVHWLDPITVNVGGD